MYQHTTLPLASQRQIPFGSAQLSPANRLVVCVFPRKLPAIFLPYYFIFKPPPIPGTRCHHHNRFFSLVRLSRLDAIFSGAFPPFFYPFLSCPCSFSTVRSYSAFVSPSVSSSPLSSFLFPRHRSFHGAASPQSRDLVHRHFICVSFARRSRTLLLLLFSSFSTALSLLFLLDVFSHLLLTLFRCYHFLSPFHENYSPTSLPTPGSCLPCNKHRTRYRPIMTVTG